MKALTRKLLRDLGHLRGQTIAIALVVAAGIAMFVMSLSTYAALLQMQERYYTTYRFADVFAVLKRAPDALVDRIRALPGVARAETRVVAEVVLDVPGLLEPAAGRLISIPDELPGVTILNDVHLRAGRYPEPGHTNEVLVSEAFAAAHQFQPGATIAALINGHWTRLTLVGIALSPEYTFQIRAGAFFPDDKRFGVLWMPRTALAAALDMTGAFNDVSLVLAPGVKPEPVIAALDGLLEPYGGIGAYPRSRQISHRYLSDEIAGLRGSGLVVPVVFLGVAAFLLHVVLARTIATQRGQIATLKAFGYAGWQVGLHYLELVLIIVLLGAVLGTALGAWLGSALTTLYSRFYRFPVLVYELPLSTVLQALGCSVLAAVTGALSSVRGVMRLAPAEAMQPEPPPSFRATLLERLGLARFLSPPTRMILRNLERRPVRAALSVLAMALAVSILVLGEAQSDAIDLMMAAQFEHAQREDLTVTFFEPQGSRARFELSRKPGVLTLEPFRAVPATLRNGHKSYELALLGLPKHSQLRRPVDQHLRTLVIPPHGVALTRKLGELLGVGAGDVLRVEIKEGRRPVRAIQVTALVDELVGVSAYMELEALNHLMEEGPLISGAYLKVDFAVLDALYRELRVAPRVAGISTRTGMLTSFRETYGESMRMLVVWEVLFAVIIAFGVVYNAARITLAERSRELASLRVLGMTRREISFILLGELAIVTALAIPAGAGLGYLFVYLVATAYETDLFRIPVIVESGSYAFAAAVIVIAALLSALLVRRKLDHLDLVEVLKTRE